MKAMNEKWICPEADVQVFMPQNYVAACELEDRTVYHADCGQGLQFKGSHGMNDDWYVFPLSADRNGNGLIDANEVNASGGAAAYLGHWHQCGQGIDGKDHFTTELKAGYIRPTASGTADETLLIYYWQAGGGYHVCDGNVTPDYYKNLS